jgi:hypothetical protein
MRRKWVKVRQSEDYVKQNQSAFPTVLWLTVVTQFFDRLLKLKADDIHERLNDPPHLIANQVFQILARKIHGFMESVLFQGIRIIRPLLDKRFIEGRGGICSPCTQKNVKIMMQLGFLRLVLRQVFFEQADDRLIHTRVFGTRALLNCMLEICREIAERNGFHSLPFVLADASMRHRA